MPSFSILFVMRVALALVASSVIPAAVFAQETTPRAPVRGWLASGRSGPREGQALSLTARALGQFGSRELGDAGLQAGIRYGRKTRNENLFVSAETSRWQFDQFGLDSSLSHDVAGSFTANLGRRTSVKLSENFRTTPFYQVEFAAREIQEQLAETTAPSESISDYSVFRRDTSSLTSAVTISHLLARHTSLSFDYAIDQRRTDDTRFISQYVKVGLSHSLGRYASAHAGYGRRIVDRRDLLTLAQSPVLGVHDIDLGIDYNRPLALSRRTKMMISTGSAVVPADGRQQYRLVGGASLLREMRRTWKASLNYGRNLEFVETFAQPLLSDTIALSLQGRFNRRLDLAILTNVSKGSIGFADNADHDYDSYGASARLRWSVTRLVSSYVEYVTYDHAFGEAVQMPIGFGRNAKRSEIRVGLSVWAPLIR